jgi:two-component system sensor histidine kinase KdpD
VWTTLNVQHLESVNDIVQQVTRVQVRETVPDAMFDRAHEIEVVDLSPDDLLARLQDGKVYLGDAADRAAESFFAKGNLIALRELALRRAAERVDAQVSAWRRDHGIAEPWNTGERLLVAVGPAPQAANLVRTAYRMATRLRAPWIAATVEGPWSDGLPAADVDRLQATLALAERLGGETVVLRGESVADELIALARARNVSRIVAGRPTHPRWRDRLAGSLVESLMREAEGIDILVTTGEPPDGAPPAVATPRAAPAPGREYGEALAGVVLAGAAGLVARPWLSSADLAMLMLAAVVLAATRVGTGPAMAAAVASVAAFDFLFVDPYYTFAVADQRYLLTFAVMLAVAAVVVRLTGRVREQADSARARERRTASLYAMSRELAVATDAAAIAAVAVAHIRDLLDCDAVLWLVEGGQLVAAAGGGTWLADDARERAVSQWVVDHGRAAGRGTDTLPAAEALHVPLIGASATVGVLAIGVGRLPRPPTLDQRLMLDAFASKAAVAIERSLLAVAAEHARLVAETERLKNDLLSAVSHDLRTPLASITGSAAALLEQPGREDEARIALLTTIRGEGERLGRLVADLLDLTRIQSGAVRADREWYPVDELVHATLDRLEELLRGREVAVSTPDDVLLIAIDPTLMAQVLVNLVENAAKYTPAGTPIAIAAGADGDEAWLEVRDRGPGIAPGDEERIFEKFYRAADGQRPGGTGLGLPICRAIVRAHGGRIDVHAREGGGAVFRVVLPIGRSAPP